MNSTFNPIPDVLLEAAKDGDLIEPVTLLSALSALDNPINALSDHDKANALFATLDADFGFVRFAWGAPRPLQPADQSRWASLIRWLVRELTVWQQTEDPVKRRLTAIFVVAQASDREGGLWELLPASIGKNSELLEYLKKLVGSLTVTFTAHGRAEPIWEREAVDRFQIADEQADWVAISHGLQAFEHQIFPTTVLAQSVRCLYRFDVGALADALANLRQTPVATQVASSLHVDQRFELALRSDNPYVQFGCLYWTLTGRRSTQKFSSTEERLLTALLLKVADDEPRWAQWMEVFNAYPIRYPALQISLGNALAEAAEPAVLAYVDAMVLQAKEAKPEPGRQIVADCLREFHAKALPGRRALLWRHAYERWSAWNFEYDNVDSHLLSICWSDLDYAVVAFATECMSEADRAKEMNAIIGEMQLLDDKWHLSQTDIVTSWNRLLSRFQPYAHTTETIKSGGDWLPETRTYLPFDPAANQYLTMKYRLI
jgi:hypothetical protein